MHKRFVLLLIVAVSAIGIAQAQSAPKTTYYRTTSDIQYAIEQSEWGHARGVYSTHCEGQGKFQKDVIGSFTFAKWRCALSDKSFDQFGYVTVVTTGPETWKPVGKVIPPKCRN